MATAVSPASAGTAQPIAIDGFVKRFGAHAAVDGVSLAVQAGECLGLLGPNGAGKTTLIRGIAGRMTPNAGSIRIFGASAGTPAAHRVLGWVPQELAIYPRLTCRENLNSFGRYQGLSGRELDERAAWCLDWAALADRAGAPAHHLSGGMKRRLNMAAGIIHRPSVVLMDEPTVGVDPQSRIRIFEMIEALREQGTSILYTTHYMEEAERLCSRIAVIDHGRIIAEGTHEELVRSVFGSSTQVVARFSGPADGIAAWVTARGGRVTDGAAHFTIERPAEIAAMLDSATQAGFEPADVLLRRPNLEAVFLQLTGRELRD